MIPRAVTAALAVHGVEMGVVRHQRKIESVILWAPPGRAFAYGGRLHTSRPVYRCNCWGDLSILWDVVVRLARDQCVPLTNKERAREWRRGQA